MPIIEWEDCYLIGVPKIDNHHQHLFSLLNKTYDNFIRYVPTDELDRIFDQLIDYAGYHFSAEEQLMKINRFPGFEMHKTEHDTFSRKVLGMQTKYHGGKRSSCLEFLSFLNTWLSNHILIKDAEIGRFLASGNADRSRDTGETENRKE
jgi:hemerythrin